MNIIDFCLNSKEPWEKEPNRVEFVYKDYRCLILRSPTMKHLCGYVAITDSHKAYKQEMNDLEVHGGVTFSNISNVLNFELYYDSSYEGSGKRIWWIGFDCAHANDYIPSIHGTDSFYKNNVYRTVGYVTEQLKYLVDQLINL